VGRTEDPSSNAAVLLLIDCLVSSKSVETISRAIAVHSAQLKEIGYDDVSGAATGDFHCMLCYFLFCKLHNLKLLF
jgi:hypothetical protein